MIPPEKYTAIVRLLAFFAEQLSGLSNQLVTEKNNAEPPLVLKARSTSTRIRPKNYLWPMWRRRPGQASSISAKFSIKLPG